MKLLLISSWLKSYVKDKSELNITGIEKELVEHVHITKVLNYNSNYIK